MHRRQQSQLLESIFDDKVGRVAGNVSVPPYTNSLQYTPLQTSAYNRVFFTVTMEQMDVNGSALPVSRVSLD